MTEHKMYHAKEVAQYCLYYCTQIGQPISNLQLQKILYYVQANFLVTKGSPCFSDEIVAWKYGPVVEDVYYYYKPYLADKITIEEFNGEIEPLDKQLIEQVCDSKSKYSAGALVRQTHQETPWKVTSKSASISQKTMKSFFSENQVKIRQ